MRPFALSILLFATTLVTTFLSASEPMCGTSPENDLRVLALHERTRQRLTSLAVDPTRPATLREGAFHLQNDETITPGYRPFDLAGQSLVFTPAGDAAFTLRREALQYVEPAGEPVRDFRAASGADWHFVVHDLPFALPLFGKSVTRIYVTAFNGIHTAAPAEQKGTQFDAIEAAVHRGPVLSPLMITVNKPSSLDYPSVWIDQQPDAVLVTWRSATSSPFRYDLQARLASDGTVTYSYRSVLAMRFGAPILSPGFDPAQVTRTTLVSAEDLPNDVSNSIPGALRPMLDVRQVAVHRIDDSDLFAVRITLAGVIDRSKLAEGQFLRYNATVGKTTATIHIDPDVTRVISFSGLRYDVDGAAASVQGNVVELYGVQREVADEWTEVSTSWRSLSGGADSATTRTPFTSAPRSVITDLSAIPQNARLDVPIAEPFVLGELDPYQVWELLQTSYGLSNFDYDAVAIYQTFFTDLVLYAKAYATGGNPQVNGITAFSPVYGTHAARTPTLLHMNQLAYGHSTTEQGASHVMLHELGHRWLYRFSIMENGQSSRALSPVSNHPAAYVHTPSAFPVYGESEASVMGGGYFTPQSDGSYRAHAANLGYSWTDLYLMGLAAPEEAPPWFYLAGTDLPREYYPQEGAVAHGDKRDVEIGQITAVHGPRNPSTALSQRQFRVAFVLVTESGTEATDAEVAKLNEWRRLMERNFAIATGGRARLVTTFVRPGKRRGVR